MRQLVGSALRSRISRRRGSSASPRPNSMDAAARLQTARSTSRCSPSWRARDRAWSNSAAASSRRPASTACWPRCLSSSNSVQLLPGTSLIVLPFAAVACAVAPALGPLELDEVLDLALDVFRQGVEALDQLHVAGRDGLL